MNKIVFLLSGLIFSISLSAQNYKVVSPNKQLKVEITIDKQINWRAMLKGNIVIENASIAMDFESGVDFGLNPVVLNTKKTNVKQNIKSTISNKDAVIVDNYSELTINFQSNYKLIFRVYDDGFAYRFVDENNSSRKIRDEKMDLKFPEGTSSLFPQEESMYSHNERLYLEKELNNLSNEDFCSLPVMFLGKHGKILFTETDLSNYPGMYLKGGKGETMHSKFPPYVLRAIPADDNPDRNQNIVEVADYIASQNGARTYPWRLFIVSDDDRTFVESNLAFQLAHKQMIENTDWIKPGKVAWDWYNANNIYGVDFSSGINTETYKYYIDFASKNNIEYVILDEGWTKSTTEILEFNPQMDIPEIINYANNKKVGIILWVLWKPLDENMDKILETYKSWGAKGIKVDFMQRSDQYMVASYEKIAAKCAQLELLVDFHGAFKPSGLRRKYPNVLNYEGVKGSENNKWSNDITPEHNVTIPFIRMAAGPMDYTPGSMNNRLEESFAISFERPMSLGTRAHQIAMYIVYEAPLQMLCESPSRYYKEQETVDFISKIPTIWEETIVLNGKIGDYITVARRNNEDWFIGSMTDWTSRELSIDLSFLSDGNYSMTLYRDGINSNRFAEDYKIEKINVNKNTVINANLAPGGGWSAIIKKLK